MNWEILLVGLLGVALLGLGFLGVDKFGQDYKIWQEDARGKLASALNQSKIKVDKQVLTLITEKPKWMGDVASDLYKYNDNIMVLDTLFYYGNKLARASQFVVRPSAESNPQVNIAQPFLYCWEVNGDGIFQQNHCFLDLRENSLNGDELKLEQWMDGWQKSHSSQSKQSE